MKKMSIAAVGLALTLGVAGVAPAQSTDQRPPRERGGQMQRGPRRGGPEAMLLKGITLTEDQKARISALRKDETTTESREQFRKSMEAARAARQRGDTAAATATMRGLRTQMEARRDRHLAAVRTVLTTEQQKQFDANVAEWKQRAQANRGEWGKRGERGGRGQQRGS